MKLRSAFYLVVAILSVVIYGCKKDDSSGNSSNTSVLDPCNHVNGSMRWTFNGVSGCANSSLFADAAIVLTAMGMQSSGETLVMELDSMAVGTYVMNEDQNTIVYTDNLSMAWITSNNQPGSLVITENNTSTNHIRLTINASLKNVLSGQSRQLTNCTLDAYYTE
jgi:Family of unknown function (DUF6252)